VRSSLTAPALGPFCSVRSDLRSDNVRFGTDHLLAGLMSEGVAAAILEKLGISRSAIEQAALHLFQPTQQVVVDHPETSAEARSALAEAQTFNQDTRLGTEHLLAALVLDPGSRARRVLNELNVDIAAIKRELACYVDIKGGRRRRRKTTSRPNARSQDLRHASSWINSTPAEIRATFSPAKVRKQAGSFSDKEYWSHSDTSAIRHPREYACSKSLTRLAKSGPTALRIDDRPRSTPSSALAGDRKVLSIRHPRYTRARARQRGAGRGNMDRLANADPVPAMLGTLN
jgi:hypothetical protein